MVGKYHSPNESVETAPWPLTGRNGETWALTVRRELLDGKRSVYTLNQIGHIDLFFTFTDTTFDESVPFPRRQQFLVAAILEAKPDDFIIELVKVARATFDGQEQRKILYDRVLGEDKIVDFALERGTPAVKQAFMDWESDFATGGKFERR